MPKPKKQKEPKPDIKEQLIQTIRTTEKGSTTTHLRVVDWIVDGRPTGHKLEKRQFYKTREGRVLTGKNVGLTRNDVNFIISNWDDINVVFK